MTPTVVILFCLVGRVSNDETDNTVFTTAIDDVAGSSTSTKNVILSGKHN